MPASDRQTLYQFENAIEAAAKSIIVAIPLNAYRQRDSDTVATPWAMIQLHGTRAAGAVHMIGDVGWPSDFEATLAVTIRTNRGQNASSHTNYVGKVREAMYNLTNWNAVRLPYHTVWSVMESGTTIGLDQEERQDITEISFTIKFLINEAAWP
ncbi:MAG: hypothetical protein EB141_13340 [Verrucomicrobia bacterium]|nr:hypothetical protein [Verrucomicrobiota bacterium]NBU11422.1 hypothetical protein [Pseudomonadota bacterium]NDA68665.1 hypothetical protein [Verrucomicrobiota bacterium]NDB76603.1 hypothetical protein [Verrucomicrobiota bacterium]NDD39907.1 hypothetical protein [Verrucomicrobiota bacterium]